MLKYSLQFFIAFYSLIYSYYFFNLKPFVTVFSLLTTTFQFLSNNYISMFLFIQRYCFRFLNIFYKESESCNFFILSCMFVRINFTKVNLHMCANKLVSRPLFIMVIQIVGVYFEFINYIYYK